VIKHLESAIKDKLEKSGLDTGGRQIEVKVITSSGLPTDDITDGLGEESDEARQIQHMIYNLMVSLCKVWDFYCKFQIRLENVSLKNFLGSPRISLIFKTPLPLLIMLLISFTVLIMPNISV